MYNRAKGSFLWNVVGKMPQRAVAVADIQFLACKNGLGDIVFGE